MQLKLTHKTGTTLMLCILSFGTERSMAQSVVLDSQEEKVVTNFSWIPYAFYTESFGLGIGAGASYSGWPKEPANVFGAGTVGTSGSFNLIGGMNDFQMPGVPRLVINPFFSFGRYMDQRFYVGRNPAYGGERAGSNRSDPDHYIEATEWDNRVEIDFRYLIPTGHGKEDIVSRYVIQTGILTDGASGGSSWNPIKSGRSTLSIKPAWREQTLDRPDLNFPFKTLNAQLALEHNNYDFPFNPTEGSFKKLAYKKDFTDDEQQGGWESWSFEFDKVFNLGDNRISIQQVLALGFWTSYVPTWQDGDESTIRRPPPFEGATLGGLQRMRAFEDNRFQDKAAIYYTTEYRSIPLWQPFKGREWMKWADIDWWQWVVFAEAGQVAPNWSIKDLHDHLHVDGGLGVRIMTHKAVCRIGFAVGEEGLRVTAMYGHPF